MPSPSRPHRGVHARYRALIALGCFVLAASHASLAAESASKRSYNLPADDAANALKLFSQQSGSGVIAGTDLVKGIRTNAVRGELTAAEALDRMLDGTGLVGSVDRKSGTFAVRKATDAEKNVERAAPAVTSDRPNQNRSKSGNEETAIVLSPFEVTTEKDTGFAAAGSLAGGRLAGELRDTPVAYSVVTREFIDALGIVDLREAAQWSTGNTEIFTNGQENFFANTDQYSTRGFTSSPNGSLRQRNFFPQYNYGDSYDLERYDFGRGPNSILFGNGSLGGVSSSTTKRAKTDRAFQTVKMSVGSWQNFRSELDVNQPLLDQKAAVRASLLWSDSKGWRDHEFDKRKGAFLTTTLKPFKNTEIRLEGEYFKNARQGSRTDTGDAFSGWDGVTTFNAATPLATLPANANALGIGRSNTSYVFDPLGPANAIFNYQNDAVTLGGGATATTPIAGFTQVGGSFNTAGANLIHAQAVPAGRFDTAIAKSFFRPISEEYTTLPDGPELIQYFRDVQLTVSQRLGEHFFFEIAGDVNTADLFINRSSTNLINILIDINRVLPNGAPNLNFLQPYNDVPLQRNRFAFNNRNLRGAAAYVMPANRFGKFTVNVLGGINHRERNQDYRFLTLNEGSDHRQWGNPNTQQVSIRRYWNAPSRPTPGGWGEGGRNLGETPVNFIDPITGVSKTIQPRWTIDDFRADTQAFDTSDYKYALASLNAKFFKDRLVLLGAVRYDTYKFAVDIQKNRGDYPLDWEGRNRIMRPDAPADYQTLKYQPRNAAGVPNAPVTTAITRPRIAATGDRDPLYLNDRFQDDYNPPDLTGHQITRSLGTVLHLFSWFNPSINFAETFNPPNGTPRINGQLHQATVAKGTDYGLRLELFKRRLDVNFTYYEAEEINSIDGTTLMAATINDLINANATGDQSLTGTNIQGVAPLPLVYRDSQSRIAQGFEVEVAYNPTKAIRLTGNYSKPKTGSSNRQKDTLGYIAANSAAFKKIALDAGALINANNVASVDPSIPINTRSPDVQGAVNAYNTIFEWEKTWTGNVASLGDSQARGNLFADYTFQSGWIKRLRLGAGVRYYGRISRGNRANDSIRNPANPAQAIDDPTVDNTTRVYAPGYSIVTGTLFYSWKLKDRRELQANLVVNNLLNDRGPLYYNTVLRPKGGDYTSPARETVFNLLQLKKPISYNLSLTLKL